MINLLHKIDLILSSIIMFFVNIKSNCIKLKNGIIVLLKIVNLRWCKVRANLLHLSDNKRYYVLPTIGGWYIVRNSDWIREYNRRTPGKFRDKNIYLLLKNSPYHTK